MGLKTKGGTELPYIYDKYSFCSLIYLTLLGDYSRNKLLPNADYTLGLFSHSLHSCSWGKAVQEHSSLICMIVPGIDRIFPQSSVTTLGALSEDIL